jgi:hypothetical protein
MTLRRASSRRRPNRNTSERRSCRHYKASRTLNKNMHNYALITVRLSGSIR